MTSETGIHSAHVVCVATGAGSSSAQGRGSDVLAKGGRRDRGCNESDGFTLSRSHRRVDQMRVAGVTSTTISALGPNHGGPSGDGRALIVAIRWAGKYAGNGELSLDPAE